MNKWDITECVKIGTMVNGIVQNLCIYGQAKSNPRMHRRKGATGI